MLKAIAKQFVPPGIWTQLRLMRMQWGITSYSQRTAHHRFGSCELEVLLADPEGAGWYDHDWQELPELALLKQGRLKPGARVFDIGAHQCVVALMLAKVVGQDGFVLALEPNPHKDSGLRQPCANVRRHHSGVALPCRPVQRSRLLERF